ncbi:MAG: hypothetical protein U1A77_19965 [Pirellulales bacterium]
MFPISDFSALGLGGMDSAHYAMWLAGADPENSARFAEGRALSESSESPEPTQPASFEQRIYAEDGHSSTEQAEQAKLKTANSTALGRLLHFVWN